MRVVYADLVFLCVHVCVLIVCGCVVYACCSCVRVCGVCVLTLMPASRSAVMVSGTPSCSRSSTAVAPSSVSLDSISLNAAASCSDGNTWRHPVEAEQSQTYTWMTTLDAPRPSYRSVNVPQFSLAKTLYHNKTTCLFKQPLIQSDGPR